MAVIRTFRELIVYRKAREEAKRIFELTKRFPQEEKFALTGQIRRSSRAVGAMVAEGWARRRYRASFVSKLVEAVGEAMETQGWLDSALDCGYISMDEHCEMDEQWRQVGAMLAGMIEKSDSFCRTPAGKRLEVEARQ